MRRGRLGLRVVIDPNVWASGLIAPNGAPAGILRAAQDGQLEPVVSWELLHELVDVLARPRLRRYGIADHDVKELVGTLSPLLPTVVVNVEMRDVDDVAVIAAALAGRAEAIITGDRDFLDDPELRTWLRRRGVEALMPADALRPLGR